MIDQNNITPEMAEMVSAEAIALVNGRFYNELLPKPHYAEIIAWDLLKAAMRTPEVKKVIIDAVVKENARQIEERKKKLDEIRKAVK